MEDRGIKKRVLANLASNYLLTACGMVLGFFLVPFLVRKLGREAFGVTVLVESVVILSEVITVSVRVAMSRFATVALAQSKMDEFARVLASGKRILNVSSLIVATAGFSAAIFFPWLFRVSDSLAWESQLLFATIVFGAVVNIQNIVYWAGVYAKQRFDLINLANSMSLVSRAVLIFVLFSLLPPEWVSLPVYGIIYLFMILIQNLIIVSAHRRLFPGLRWTGIPKDNAQMRQILSYSGHTTVSRMSGFLYTDTSNIIINRLWGTAYNAVFSVALKIPQLMHRVFVESTFTLTPTLTDLVARNNHAAIRALVFTVSKVLALISYPLILTLFVWNRAFILAWVGPDFMEAADILPVFLTQLFVSIPLSTLGCLENAYGKVKIPSRVSLSCGILNVGLVFLLGWFFQLQLLGVALAAFTAVTLVAGTFHIIYACRISGLSIRRFVYEVFLKPALALVPIAAAFHLMVRAGWNEKIDPIMIPILALIYLVYYFIGYRFVLQPEERLRVRGLINDALKKIRRGRTEPDSCARKS